MSLIHPPPAGVQLPDHTQLPETDGSIVENFQELPLHIMLSDSIRPYLDRRHPDGRYLLGHDSGIYWRYVREAPLQGCKAPDWFYVPGVGPLPPGQFRRSYVLWKELVPPQVILEFVSGDGSEEHDATPETGKFWVYEQAVRAAYYGIFDGLIPSLEMYRLTKGAYELMAPNERGRYFLPPLDLELGVWHGDYFGMEMPWLRWWDDEGNLLEMGWENADRERKAKKTAERLAKRERLAKEQAERRVESERAAKEQAERLAERERSEKEQAKERAELLAAKLRALGVDPEM